MKIKTHHTITINYAHLIDGGMNIAKVSEVKFKSKKKAYDWVNDEVNKLENTGNYVSAVTIESETVIDNK
jgi:hypothetical protein